MKIPLWCPSAAYAPLNAMSYFSYEYVNYYFYIDKFITSVLYRGMEPWEKIRQAREAKGWSQDFLAKQVGISQPAIKKIEDGSTAQSKFLPRIAALLGLDITELDEGLARITASPDRAPRLIGGVDFPVHASA